MIPGSDVLVASRVQAQRPMCMDGGWHGFSRGGKKDRTGQSLEDFSSFESQKNVIEGFKHLVNS